MDRKGVIIVNEKEPCTGKGLIETGGGRSTISSRTFFNGVRFSKIPAEKIQLPRHQARAEAGAYV
ncbi:hypothetical protein SUGI_0520710 [Cryptomeria japonica]|nr:hypothetical protein SUGI_0520710 [Cryptomeria japonica]